MDKDRLWTGIITFLLGCTLTAGGYTLAVSNNVARNTVEITNIKNSLDGYLKVTIAIVDVNKELIKQLEIQRASLMEKDKRNR